MSSHWQSTLWLESLVTGRQTERKRWINKQDFFGAAIPTSVTLNILFVMILVRSVFGCILWQPADRSTLLHSYWLRPCRKALTPHSDPTLFRKNPSPVMFGRISFSWWLVVDVAGFLSWAYLQEKDQFQRKQIFLGCQQPKVPKISNSLPLKENKHFSKMTPSLPL